MENRERFNLLEWFLSLFRRRLEQPNEGSYQPFDMQKESTKIKVDYETPDFLKKDEEKSDFENVQKSPFSIETDTCDVITDIVDKLQNNLNGKNVEELHLSKTNSNHTVDNSEIKIPVSEFQLNDKYLSQNNSEQDIGCNTMSEEKKSDRYVVTEMNDTTSSLLDNKPFVKLFDECCDIINEFERHPQRYKKLSSEDLLEIVRENIITALCLSGGTLIDKEEIFDSLRHKCKDNIDVKEGSAIDQILYPGVSLEEKIGLRAIVTIKNDNNNE